VATACSRVTQAVKVTAGGGWEGVGEAKRWGGKVLVWGG